MNTPTRIVIGIAAIGLAFGLGYYTGTKNADYELVVRTEDGIIARINKATGETWLMRAGQWSKIKNAPEG